MSYIVIDRVNVAAFQLVLEAPTKRKRAAGADAKFVPDASRRWMVVPSDAPPNLATHPQFDRLFQQHWFTFIDLEPGSDDFGRLADLVRRGSGGVLQAVVPELTTHIIVSSRTTLQ